MGVVAFFSIENGTQMIALIAIFLRRRRARSMGTFVFFRTTPHPQ
jgi:hypothetical protein